MCNFLSAIVLKNGDVLTHWALDSHSDLVQYFKLPDANAHIRHFAKVELTPDDWMDESTWRFRLDEDTQPAWWRDVAVQAEDNLRSRAARMILATGEHDLIMDGAWIVGGDAKVRDVRSGRIMRVRDSAQIHGVGGSAQIHGVRDHAQIRNVGDHAQIHDVGDHAQIRNVWGYAQIRNVWGYAQIRNVWDHAQIHDVWGYAGLDETAKAHVVKK